MARNAPFKSLRVDETFFLSSGGQDIVLRRLPRFPVRNDPRDLGIANSPMPGQVLKILVEKGQHVGVGQALVILEAMKMEQTIRAAVAGIVEAILVEQGAVVSPGDLLVRIASPSESVE
jgi:biotin carboxyl carrier protein